MKNVLWSAVYDLVQGVDSLLSRAERFDGAKGESAGAGVASAAAPDPAKKSAGKAAFFRVSVPQDALVEGRAQTRSRLDLLKSSLAEHLTERESFLVLFPLVIFFDEIVQNRFVAG